MDRSELMIRTALTSLIAMGLAGAATAAETETEKCAGIAKAGKNGCHTATNSCAGSVKHDRDPNAWISVPKGTCEKIVGGRVIMKESKPVGADDKS